LKRRNASAVVAPALKNRHFFKEKRNKKKNILRGSRQKRIWKATSALSHNSGSQVPLRCTQILLHFIPQNFWRTAKRCAQ